MKRFQREKRKSISGRWLTLAALGLALLLFERGMGQVSETTRRQQQLALEQALESSVTYCYAMEGAYPESLAYLREHYGIHYDESRFFVDYRVQGGNLRPEITVLPLAEGKGK